MYRVTDVLVPVLSNGSALTEYDATAGSLETNPLEVGKYSELIAFLTVHDATIVGTLDVKFQTSADLVNWVDTGDAFTQVTSGETTTMKKLAANFGMYVRAVVTVGSGDQYVFSLKVVGKV